MKIPGTIGDWAEPKEMVYEYEEMLYVTVNAYKTKTGKEFPYEKLTSTRPVETTGESWKEEQLYGGDVLYLCRWMRESGLADLLPSLRETVYVGVSAGSMVTAPIFGETYDDLNTPFVIEKGLGLVDFALLPHLDHENHPESSTAKVERMAAEVPVPTYGIDDQAAIKVTGGTVEVVSEGHWKRFTP